MANENTTPDGADASAEAAQDTGRLAPPAIPAEIRQKLRENWGLLMALGVLLILGGMAAIFLPVAASLAVELMVGVVFLFAGGMQAVHAWRCEGWKCRVWSGSSALLYILGGAFLLLNPLAGIVALTTILIFVIGFDGVLRIVMGFTMRPEEGWGWTVVGGVAALAMAVLMLALLPSIGFTALGVLAGIALMFEGWGFVFLSLASRRDDPAAGPGKGSDAEVPAG